ncbi:hypothetical protein BJF83_23855 [Nocardiopsis sp. CNR-923]|uniref:cupredoxin domain-containing protein n=1 Tax=Nocardiopsis sp. CNR-923 TaxID=1904965 RepID=UPI00095C221F|nr:cupredoxin domain-containing protein [Nocardiopsis sp. CNR-923]OLT24760.1 hypothetical protein BJF83_23855 [Nocardiopsis sp. CNR-923]
MARPTPLAALTLALGLALAACSGGGADAPDDTATEEQAAPSGSAEEDGEVVATIAVTAVEMSYAGFPQVLPAGTTRIDFDNAGQTEHDLVVEELGDEQIVPVIEGGASQSVTVTLQPGTYTFYCSVGDHRAMGMEVTVTVE